MKTVYAIVPLYNEEKYASETLLSLLKINTISRIVAVDDGSEDDTWNIISTIEGIDKIRHNKNKGKAESIKEAIKRFDADIYVFVDGDLGSSALKVEPLIREVLDNRNDMCIAKFPESIGGGGLGILKAFSKYAVKKIAGTDFPCPLSGQRAVKKEVILDNRVQIHSGYGIEVGMLIDTLNSGYRVGYIELDLTHRITGKDFKGYTHRLKQLKDVSAVVFKEFMRW